MGIFSKLWNGSSSKSEPKLSDSERISQINNQAREIGNNLRTVTSLFASLKAHDEQELSAVLDGFDQIMQNLRKVDVNLHFPEETKTDNGLKTVLRKDWETGEPNDNIPEASILIIKAMRKLVNDSNKLALETSGVALKVPLSELRVIADMIRDADRYHFFDSWKRSRANAESSKAG